MSDSKSYGGFSVISTVKDGSYAQHAAEFRAALATGKYDVEHSYMSDSGAYVLFEKGHNFQAEEVEAAKVMADSGIIVKLTPENDISFASAKDPKGNPKYTDGKLSVHTYEQRTPNKINERGADHTVNSALRHAASKNADVAVIYDKSGLLHRGDIQRGIQRYESYHQNKHRFKAVVVVSQQGKVYEWQHTR
ncbi:MAG: hypothetical protein NC187_08195 [Candidatus Amulumruptor caecigallinarius]|nr:hypothetical protein [Candidatus Amulumruptor caecigallinarius]MCM1397449.1 hypothetical protein [Candidatus Amulumruptor caecigallinarius]MCM1454344.1 hypothetical protein [bacterium]